MTHCNKYINKLNDLEVSQWKPLTVAPIETVEIPSTSKKPEGP